MISMHACDDAYIERAKLKRTIRLLTARCVLATEALKKDMKLLESSALEGGKGKTLVPKAIDADDEDDRGDSDDDSDDDDDEVGPAHISPHVPFGFDSQCQYPHRSVCPSLCQSEDATEWQKGCYQASDPAYLGA